MIKLTMALANFERIKTKLKKFIELPHSDGKKRTIENLRIDVWHYFADRSFGMPDSFLSRIRMFGDSLTCRRAESREESIKICNQHFCEIFDTNSDQRREEFATFINECIDLYNVPEPVEEVPIQIN